MRALMSPTEGLIGNRETEQNIPGLKPTRAARKCSQMAEKRGRC